MLPGPGLHTISGMNRFPICIRRPVLRAGLLLTALLEISLPVPVSAQASSVKREATVEAVDAKSKSVTLLLEPKTQDKNAKAERRQFAVVEEHIFRQPTGTQKVHVNFTDLKAGLRVRVKLLTPFSITPPNWASEVIILPAVPKK